MSKKLLAAIGATLILVGCSEMTSPFDTISAKRDGAGITDSTEETSQTDGTGTSETTSGSTSGLPENTLVQSSDAPPLVSYDTSFVAVQGWGGWFWLNYERTSPRAGEDTFLYVEIPWDAQLLRADGTPAAYGEAVEITVKVDPVSFFVEFGPHGSTFVGNKGTQLWFNFKYANDQGHTHDTPTIWYQPHAGEQWVDEGTKVRNRGKWVFVEIRHFSNYAVAW